MAAIGRSIFSSSMVKITMQCTRRTREQQHIMRVRDTATVSHWLSYHCLPVHQYLQQYRSGNPIPRALHGNNGGLISVPVTRRQTRSTERLVMRHAAISIHRDRGA